MGRLSEIALFSRRVRDLAVGLGYQEMIYNYLGSRRDFVERSLLRLTETWHAAQVAEAWARRPGLLQALDARAKIVALLGLVVLTAALHDAAGLGLLLAFAVVLAALSRLSRACRRAGTIT